MQDIQTSDKIILTSSDYLSLSYNQSGNKFLMDKTA